MGGEIINNGFLNRNYLLVLKLCVITVITSKDKNCGFIMNSKKLERKQNTYDSIQDEQCN